MIIYKVFVVLIFSFIFIAHNFVYLFKGFENSVLIIPEPILLLIMFSFMYYLFFGRFYKVRIDESKIYFNDLMKKGEVPFEKIDSILIEWMPYRLFFKLARGVIIKYVDENQKTKRIRFLSKEYSFFKSLRKNNEIVLLFSKFRKNYT